MHPPAIRSVTLEVLRHGPPHNQLLSPLTQYMALSDGFEPTSLHVPYEHQRFKRDLNVLRYGHKEDAAAIGLIAHEMSSLFAAVPGLIAGLTRPAEAGSAITHLRLIFSAAELSLLPFELARAPAGFPGEGMPLSLQLAGPVVITREVRASPGRRAPYPTTPRILFASASPPGFEAPPVRAHLRALVRALEPWVGPATVDLDKYLRFLPGATLRAIREACRQEQYTHIHLLAHGATYGEQNEEQFGIALHGDAGGADVVNASRLLSAIRAHRETDAGLSAPAVVSLATCDSANRSQVLVPGGSIAHELHEAGVPLVVASQFPLTMRGSVVMTDTLYRGLLRGDDPRWVLHDVRQSLSSADQQTHDWASLLVYASFGPTLEHDVLCARYYAARQAMWSTSREIDRELAVASSQPSPDPKATLKQIEPLQTFAERAAQRLPRGGKHDLDALGNIGAKLKRDSLHLYMLALRSPNGSIRKQEVRRSIEQLRAARDAYRTAARAPFEGPGIDSTIDWVIAQWLTLDFVLGEELEPAPFFMAHYLARVDATKKQGERREWAYGSLLDLELLRFGSHERFGKSDEAMVRTLFIEALEAVPRGAFMRASMGRQLKRWIDWWGEDSFAAGVDRAERKDDVACISKLALTLHTDFVSHWQD